MHTSSPELHDLSTALEQALAAGQTPVLLSDFDYTLCHDYGFNPVTNNHIPMIDQRVVALARGVELVVATSRRAENPAIARMWESGLVHPDMPIITENGGVIVTRDLSGNLHEEATIHPYQTAALQSLVSMMVDHALTMPKGKHLVVKPGRTMAILRIQDAYGSMEPEDQQLLAHHLREHNGSDEFDVVNARVSVSVQHRSVNKGAAFRTYLKTTNRLRDEVFVIGMGDGENDAPLFEEADVSIGLSPVVADMVDIPMRPGVESTLAVLRTLNDIR